MMTDIVWPVIISNYYDIENVYVVDDFIEVSM